MAELKLKTADDSLVPGREEAAAEKKKKQAKDESQANSVFAPPSSKSEDRGPNYGDQRIRFHKRDEVNIYADAEDERHAMDPRLRTVIIMFIVVIVVFVVAALMPTNIFGVERFDNTTGAMANEIANSFQGMLYTLMGGESIYSYYFFAIVATLFAGAAMGVSGGVYQGALKNALASPSTLGVTSGGTLGAVIYAVFVSPNTITSFIGTMSEYEDAINSMSPVQQFMQYYGGFVCSLIGCVVVVALIMLIAVIAGRGKVSNVSLIIAGQVFSAVIGVVITWVRLYLTTYGTEDQINMLTQAQTVTFAGPYTFISTAAFAIPVLICLVIIFCMSSRLSLLAFNDEEARSMGISTGKTRNLMVALCTILTALVISFCGPVGFVGFMVPHIARKMVGPDFRYLLPACAALGSVMVCVVYTITILGIPGFGTGSTGTWTSVVGCIMFLVMALRQRGSTRGDWL